MKNLLTTEEIKNYKNGDKLGGNMFPQLWPK